MTGSKDGGERRDKQNHYRCAVMSQPLRRRIACLYLGGEEVGTAEIAAELDREIGRIAYHLRLLVRRDVLKVVPKCRPTPPLYRWSPQAEWARKMLGENDE